MRHLTLLFVTAILTLSSAIAQPTLNWMTNLSGADNRLFNATIASFDDGMIGAGVQNAVGTPSMGYAARLSTQGTILWEHTVSLANIRIEFRDICTVNGITTEYLAVGNATNMSTGQTYIVLSQFDQNGFDLGTRTWSPGTNNTATSIEPLAGGGYVIAGAVDSQGYLFYINSSFQMEWEHYYTQQGPLTSMITDVVQRADGGFYTGGNVYDNFVPQQWVMRLNSFGSIDWSYTNQLTDYGYIEGITEAPNGDCMAVGGDLPNGAQFDAWAIRLAPDNIVRWMRNYGNDPEAEVATWIGINPYGGFFIGGYGQQTQGVNHDMMLYQVNELGDVDRVDFFGDIESELMLGYALDSNNDVIGAGVYDGSQAVAIKLDITAQSLNVNIFPIGIGGLVVPAIGANWFNQIDIFNEGPQRNADFWINLTHLDSYNSVNLNRRVNASLPANNNITVYANASIHSSAPPGHYRITLYGGSYPWIIEALDSYEFEKDIVAAPNAVTDWENVDWERAVQLTFHDQSPATYASEQADASLPASFSLGTAYPNPFNPTTSISVNLPETAELTVNVYNVTGQQVATLADGSFNAGTHSLTFDASHLSSGLYFIQATVPGRLNAIEKVTLMK